MGKGLFFNALPDATKPNGYDRNYNADDISNWLSIVWENGVCKTNTIGNEPQGLKVVASSGMTINVNAGFAAIKGKAFINQAIESFTVAANGTTSTRYDYIVIKYDNNISVRDIKLELRTGNASRPTVANLTRTASIYELMLAYIAVAPSATSIAQSNITDTRGEIDVCPWFTAIKGYEDYYDAVMQQHESTVTLTSATTTVTTNILSRLYNSRYSLIDVYTNGLREPETAYTVSASGSYIVVTFKVAKASGTLVTVILNNFIDGEGMQTALTQYTQLVQDVADLKASGEFDYICNGVNDNVLISNIVKTFYSTNDYKSLKLNVIGNIGMTAAATGTGTTANPYGWFDFTKQVTTNRVATVDFSNASAITPTIASGTVNNIFRAEEVKIIGANIVASNQDTNTSIRGFSSNSGRIYAENCRFWLTGYSGCVVAYTGTFVNCRASVTNASGNSYCFQTATTGLTRLYNGEYYAYTGVNGSVSAIVGQSGTDAVTVLYGVSAPTAARSGYYQTNAIYQVSGGGMISCTDLISALTLSVISGISNVRGTIAKSKPNLL